VSAQCIWKKTKRKNKQKQKKNNFSFINKVDRIPRNETRPGGKRFIDTADIIQYRLCT
jgi:hypothetical protein